MSPARTDGSDRAAGATRWRRWFGVALASLLLHLLALNWADGNFRLPAPDSEPPVVLQTVLVQAEAPQAAPQPAPRPKAPAPAPAKPKKPRPIPSAPAATPPSAPATPATSATETPATSAPAQTSPAADANATAQAALPPAGEPVETGFTGPDIAGTEPAATPDATTGESKRHKIDPPPPAALKYDVMALREGREFYGHGTITWRFNGSQYAIDGEAGILFFSLLNFSSRGGADEFGIAPVQYTEKRIRRTQTETLFNREIRQISFIASGKTHPLQGGEQDRASLIWQLAGIGRGDPASFAPDAKFPLFVAGVRNGAVWDMRVIGEEEVEVGLGRLRAWHVRRAPIPGDKDQTIDIWLAPSHHWYPVRIRYTEANGEYLTLSLSDIAAPGSR